MRVLIIGINYRPEVTAIGSYTAGLAEHRTGSFSPPRFRRRVRLGRQGRDERPGGFADPRKGRHDTFPASLAASRIRVRQ